MMDDLLIKYIVGEASVAERNEVEDWIGSDPANRQAYERLHTIWQHSKTPDAATAPDVDAAWKRFAARRAEETANHAPMTIRKNNSWKRFAAAAAVLLIVFSGALWYFNSGTEYRTKALAEVLTLPDQSTITLNKNSRLSYARSFNRKDRVVTLEGEGFFDVAKNPKKPFISHVKDIDVRVVGTSFNIRSTNDLTEVAVESGIVKVMGKGQTYTLRGGDKVTFKKGVPQAAVEQIQNQLYQYYRTNMFVCEGTPLPELIQGLSDAYGVAIDIQNPLLEQQHLTSKYPRTDSIEPILQNVALTLNAHLIRQANGYILK
jgi:ferric-dicitrate binding protein FerR (iron transport regulator)